jgi:Fur family transcriptional regulator, ferric uptake regulator
LEGAVVEKRIERIKEALHDARYKLTPQREVTVRVLLENESSHLSAEDVFMKVKDKYPEIGLATVYRTLELLNELNVLDKVNFGDGVSRYDLRKEGAQHFHHHLICIHCGSVEEVEEDLLTDVEKIVTRDFDFDIIDHRLTFHGICKLCKGKEGNTDA